MSAQEMAMMSRSRGIDRPPFRSDSICLTDFSLSFRFEASAERLDALSALDVARVVPVRVRLADPTVTIVDLEFRAGVTADFAAAVDRLLFRLEVSAGAFGAPATDIPASIGTR